jgi:uncharacterized protein YbbC (DUF1343 family)/CubicO group peptidase (beta-lactamase class C family)
VLGVKPSLLFIVMGLVASAGCGAAAPSAAAAAQSASAPSVRPLDTAKMAAADRAIEEAIAAKNCPGAVLIVGRGDRTGGQVLYQRAYGNKALQPTTRPMTLDTVFDLASLSKSVGCASSVMVLIEQGKISPQEKVAHYFPEFGKNGKEAISVAQLLTHQSGLIPDNPESDYHNGAAAAWRKICELKPTTPPGTAFKYSDVNFIVLGKLVEKVSGESLDKFAKAHVFEPAGMNETGYKPPATLKERAAPTEKRNGEWIVGEVHDPRAFSLGGVAGHAGVFSTGADVARFCRMVLNGGTIDGKRVLKPETVAEWIKPRALPDGTHLRTYGFDVDTPYSGPRGERFAKGVTFGHTGFTGTSFWMDPKNDCYVILLTNSVHPFGKGDVRALRRKIGTIAAEALLGPAPATQAAEAPATRPFVGPVMTGIDVLVEEQFAPLRGKRVALVTNQTGLDQQGRRTVDLLAAAPDVKLIKLFSPEHGLYGVLDEKVSDTIDPKTGLRVYSLYGKTNKPSPAMMEGVEVLVFDIQDAGARYYTYTATLGLCMEACAAAKAKLVLLDRPNPLGGYMVDGPIADEKSLGFTAYAPIPVAHGMTLGELARYYNAERKIGCDLQVVEVRGWKRSMWFDETGLTWINPSPNLRNPTQALIYLGVGQIEAANISVGRGTDQPFEMLGAPWIDGRRLAAALNDLKLPGLRFTPIRFTPSSSKFAGKECQGVYIGVTDRAAVQPVKLGIALAWTLHREFGDQFEIAKVNNLLKSAGQLERIKSAKTFEEACTGWDKDLAAFKAVREKYLIYK